MTEYVSAGELAKRWGITSVRVTVMCATGKIEGAIKNKGRWLIPEDTVRPEDRRTKKSKEAFRYIDLFCGIGGFHQGIDRIAKELRLEAECVFAADNDPFAAKVYESNYGVKCLYDLKEERTHKLIDEAIGSDGLNCLFGGFPCQPFSKAGNQDGFSNEMKGTLFFEIEKIIHRHKPQYVLLENVRNLKSHDSGHTWEVIKQALIAEGYYVDDVIISPNNIDDIPALRERFYILAYNIAKLGKEKFEKVKIDGSLRNTSIYLKGKRNNGLNPRFFNQGEPQNVENDNIVTIDMWDDLLQRLKAANRKIITPLWPHYFDKAIDLRDTPEWKIKIIKRNQEFYEKNADIYDSWYSSHKNHFDSLCRSDQKFEWNAGEEINSVWDGIIQFRPSGVRVKRPDFIPTLVAINQTPILGCEKRYLQPEEMARIYGFNGLQFGSQSISESKKQLGNTVSVDVVTYLLRHMFRQG